MRTGAGTRRLLNVVVLLCLMIGVFSGTAWAASTVGDFSYGELQASTVGASGCGTNLNNSGFGPAILSSRGNGLFLGSSVAVGSNEATIENSAVWRGTGLGQAIANGCGLQYRGDPQGVAAAGNSIGAQDAQVGDAAVASAANAAGNYDLYVASLSESGVIVATSTDNGTTFSNIVVPTGGSLQSAASHQAPIQPRMAAFGASTSLLSDGLGVWRSDSPGGAYQQIGQLIPSTDYKASSNWIGNLAIDHANLPDSSGDFYAYQAFVAPSSPPSGNSFVEDDEAFLAVSADGGHTWSDQPIPCSERPQDNLGQPSVSVAPDGSLWAAWGDGDGNIHTAESTDHGQTWTCSAPMTIPNTSGDGASVVATSTGVDLAFYGTYSPGDGTGDTHLYFVQNPTSTPTGWGAPEQLMDLSGGSTICAASLFGTAPSIDVDKRGSARIAYRQLANSQPPCSAESSTGYAVQITGTLVGSPNN